jgi:hypothetical protein
MLAFSEDDYQTSRYPSGIFDEPRAGRPFVQCLQWDAHQPDGNFPNLQQLPDVQPLIRLAETRQSALRVVFLPLRPAIDHEGEHKCFKKLIDFYSIPSAVLVERMRRVSYSFGSSTLPETDEEIAWCHFLCRNVDVKNGKIQDLGYLNDEQENHGHTPSSLWTMCDFFLHVRPKASEPDGAKKAVTLLCFGAPEAVFERFRRLPRKENVWTKAIEEPYLLFDILFDQLHEVFDDKVWHLSEAIRPEEKTALQRAARFASDDSKDKQQPKDQSRLEETDFQNLHNIQKY